MYETFAQVYDLFMQDLPYDLWISHITKIWHTNGLTPTDVLDLGCGTGSAALLLSKLGYGVVAVDASEDMLALARNKTQNHNILFLNQDMASFELYGTVEAAISICDSLNYILEPDSLLKTFKLVHNYLSPGGLFVFDINTPYKYEKILAENIFASTYDTGAYIWDNFYDTKTKINEYLITFFVETDGVYKRFEEVHYQRCYETDHVAALLRQAGLEVLHMYDSYSFEQYDKNSLCDRVCFVSKAVKYN